MKALGPFLVLLLLLSVSVPKSQAQAEQSTPREYH